MYVRRNKDEVIVGVSPWASFSEEWLPDDHSDMLAFLNPPPSVADVISERDRRLALGFDFDFSDERGVHRIGTTRADMAGWDEVTTIAQVRSLRGNETPISIVTDTGPVQVSPSEWLDILEAAEAARQPIWQASFVLQAMDPIPEDYAADHHWP